MDQYHRRLLGVELLEQRWTEVRPVSAYGGVRHDTLCLASLGFLTHSSQMIGSQLEGLHGITRQR